MRNTNIDQSGYPGDVRVQEFLDMIAPSVVKFNTDHFICGNTFRCVWALREYPTSTEEQTILKRLGEKDGVTLRIYTRHVNAAEERKIISNAASKNRMERANTNDLQQTVMAESNLQDVATIVAHTHRNREPLLHTAVYIELSASDYDRLKLLQTEVLTELIRSKLNVDRLMLRQQQGFQSVMPSGKMCSGTSSSGCCLPAAWPISIPSTTAERRIPMASMWAVTSSAAMSWWTSTRGRRTRPTAPS